MTTTEGAGMRYHRDAWGFPGFVEEQLARIGVHKFTYSAHAQQACLSDRYGIIDPPMAANIRPEIVFEAECDKSGRLVKIVMRMDYDEDFDLIIAYMPFSGLVKTVWLNEKSDTHHTLNKSEYDRV